MPDKRISMSPIFNEPKIFLVSYYTVDEEMYKNRLRKYCLIRHDKKIIGDFNDDTWSMIVKLVNNHVVSHLNDIIDIKEWKL